MDPRCLRVVCIPPELDDKSISFHGVVHYHHGDSSATHAGGHTRAYRVLHAHSTDTATQQRGMRRSISVPADMQRTAVGNTAGQDTACRPPLPQQPLFVHQDKQGPVAEGVEEEEEEEDQPTQMTPPQPQQPGAGRSNELPTGSGGGGGRSAFVPASRYGSLPIRFSFEHARQSLHQATTNLSLGAQQQQRRGTMPQVELVTQPVALTLQRAGTDPGAARALHTRSVPPLLHRTVGLADASRQPSLQVHMLQDELTQEEYMEVMTHWRGWLFTRLAHQSCWLCMKLFTTAHLVNC
jgi:hypothetical protein